MTERENITSEQLADLVKRLRDLLGRTSPVYEHIDDIVNAADVIERLRAEKIELAEGILELQRMLYARDGVPMPSERPLVDKLRAEIERLREAVKELCDEFEDATYDTSHGLQSGHRKQMIVRARSALPSSTA